MPDCDQAALASFIPHKNIEGIHARKESAIDDFCGNKKSVAKLP
jgi:hypothetical protein